MFKNCILTKKIIFLGDVNLAYQCFRLALSSNHSHAEAFNNLGVLEWRRGNTESARAFFATAASLGPHMFEPAYNTAYLGTIHKPCGQFFGHFDPPLVDYFTK